MIRDLDRYEAIEAKRVARLAVGNVAASRRIMPSRPESGKAKAWGKVQYSALERYGVYLVHDSGARALQFTCGSYEQADNEAARMRDLMTDEQCGGDWNYLPGKIG